MSVFGDQIMAVVVTDQIVAVVVTKRVAESLTCNRGQLPASLWFEYK